MAGDLLIFYLFFTYFLLTFCWRFAGDFPEICWRFAGDFAGVLLEISLPDFCWRFAGDLLKTCWRFSGDLLEICWRFAYDMLEICWRLAGDFAGVLLEICLPDFCWRFAGDLLLKVAGDLMRKNGEDDGSHFVLIVH